MVDLTICKNTAQILKNVPISNGLHASSNCGTSTCVSLLLVHSLVLRHGLGFSLRLCLESVFTSDTPFPTLEYLCVLYTVSSFYTQWS